MKLILKIIDASSKELRVLSINSKTIPIVPAIISKTLKSILSMILLQDNIPDIIKNNAEVNVITGRYLLKTRIKTYVTANSIIAGTIFHHSHFLSAVYKHHSIVSTRIVLVFPDSPSDVPPVMIILSPCFKLNFSAAIRFAE